MLIRQESPEDIEPIRKLNYAAFKDHPHHEPGAEPVEHLIVDKLRTANALTFSLVAEEGSQIIGHIAFSPVTINGQTGQWFGLGPVAVLPEKQGQRVGSTLIQKGIELMKKHGAEGIVLLGDPEYYRRFGFRNIAQLILPGVPAEYFMAYPFQNLIPSGEVAYHPDFC